MLPGERGTNAGPGEAAGEAQGGLSPGGSGAGGEATADTQPHTPRLGRRPRGQRPGPMHTACCSNNSQRWERLKCHPGADGQMHGRWSVHTMKHSITKKSEMNKNEIMTRAATWMNLRGMMLNGITHHKRANAA